VITAEGPCGSVFSPRPALAARTVAAIRMQSNGPAAEDARPGLVGPLYVCGKSPPHALAGIGPHNLLLDALERAS